MKGMKVLVTGSEGFVGKELCRRLREKGIEVVPFDLALGKNILDKEQLAEAMKGVHAIVHLAALLDESAPAKKLFEINVQGTRSLLEAASKGRIGRLVFLSTVGAMGNIQEKANEEAQIAPVTNYEKSKAEAEKAVQEFQEMIPITIIRSALVLGANEYWAQIAKLLKKGFPLIGEGNNKWQMVYYKDLADAIVFMLENPTTEHETFIVAEEECHSLREVAEMINTMLGTGKPLKTVPLWLGKLLAALYGIRAMLLGKKALFNAAIIERLQRNREYDLTKIHAYGWKAKFSTEKALKETIEELKAHGRI
jgi:nucleoside-diphosphate-sugar epimerase